MAAAALAGGMERERRERDSCKPSTLQGRLLRGTFAARGLLTHGHLAFTDPPMNSFHYPNFHSDSFEESPIADDL